MCIYFPILDLLIAIQNKNSKAAFTEVANGVRKCWTGRKYKKEKNVHPHNSSLLVHLACSV